MKAMILAAGMGTRLKPLTNNIPKALVEINGIPMIEIVINSLIKQGITRIIINLHHFADEIETFLKSRNNFNIEIVYSDERDKLLDTGGGLKKASWYFNDNQPFLLHAVDVFTDLNLDRFIEAHKKSDNLVTLAVRDRPTTRNLLFNGQGRLSGWKNNQTGESVLLQNGMDDLVTVAFSGIHIISPELFNYMPGKNIFSITDFYLQIAKKQPISYFSHNEGYWIDMGKFEGIGEAGKLL